MQKGFCFSLISILSLKRRLIRLRRTAVTFLLLLFSLLSTLHYLLSTAVYADSWDSQSYINAVFSASSKIKSFEEDVTIYKNEYVSRIADAFMPSLTINASYIPYSNYNAPKWDFSKDNASANTQVALNLFNNYKDKLDIDIARIDRDVSKDRLWMAKQETAFAALKTYYSVLMKKRLLEVVRTSLKSYEEQYHKVKDYYKNGMKSLSDVLKSELNLRSSQLQEVTSIENYKNSIMDFNLAIKRNPDTEIELLDIVEYSSATLPAFEQDVQFAVNNRIELKLARLELKKKKISKLKSKIDLYPDFSIDAAWNRQGIGSIGRPVTGIANPTYSLAMTLSVPLGPATISDKNSLTQSQIEIERAVRSLRDRELEIKRGVVSAYLALQTAVKRYEVSKMKSGISKQNLEIVQQKYNQGRAAMVELADAQGDDLQSQSELADSLYALVLAEAEYKKALGIQLW